MAPERAGTLGDHNPTLAALRQHIQLGELMPPGSEPHRLARELGNLPTLPDRFNAAFIPSGWVFVEFACSVEIAERALQLKAAGTCDDQIDRNLAGGFLGLEPIRCQALKLLGGGLVEPRFPVRAEVTERAFKAYEAGDYLVAVPLMLMLIDGFGVSATGTKSIFSDLEKLDEMFQSTESMAGHPSALKALLAQLGRSKRGYSEEVLTLPLRNGILHGTRLNYANEVVAAKTLNLLAAVIEWARDIAPEPKSETARREWNERFLRANLERLKPESPERALDLLVAALAEQRASDIVSLIDYLPLLTNFPEKMAEWRELHDLAIVIEPLSAWETFGDGRPGTTARCQVRLTLSRADGSRIVTEARIFAERSVALAEAGLPSSWQISLTLLGLIRALLRDG
ncbi:MAG TPA: hypothetical protein VF631_07510 [Allosphingosinicella sp.]|jgi:hypothetical protein|uniref:hypothetical protein n=1 Tax=Allosphingosinicella sp. TaxID=2823234 RepID=UPI002F29626F